MTIGYSYLKNWRHRTKERIIEAMGGKCAICGYNKCPSALALHHLDPTQKDFNFANQSGTTPKNWNKLVMELRKCVLVCHNCHCEIHANVIVVPQDVIRFNESFSSYAPLRVKKFDPCVRCGKLKAWDMKFCSKNCAQLSQRKVDWDNIDLAKEIEQSSILALAKRIGCSDAAIHKRMRRLGLK